MATETHAWLSERPEWVPRLAALHHAQWSPLLPHWTLAQAQADLASHHGGARVPTTLLALVDGELAGSVSLLANDDERIRAWSPWLASLLVLPEYRGRGIGERLVRRCVALAHSLGIGTLYLYTDYAAAWYEKLGWARIARSEFDTASVDVMAIDTASRAEAAA